MIPVWNTFQFQYCTLILSNNILYCFKKKKEYFSSNPCPEQTHVVTWSCVCSDLMLTCFVGCHFRKSGHKLLVLVTQNHNSSCRSHVYVPMCVKDDKCKEVRVVRIGLELLVYTLKRFSIPINYASIQHVLHQNCHSLHWINCKHLFIYSRSIVTHYSIIDWMKSNV